MIDSRIKLIMELLLIVVVYPGLIMLLSQLLTPLSYGEALLYSFIVRVIKWNKNNIFK
jgi:hypothetical protein